MTIFHMWSETELVTLNWGVRVATVLIVEILCAAGLKFLKFVASIRISFIDEALDWCVLGGNSFSHYLLTI